MNSIIKKIKLTYLVLCSLIAVLAIVAVLASPFMDVTVNMTSSLSGTVYVVHKGAKFNKGDLVAYRWKGGATYPAGVTFIKRATGFPNDIVTRSGNRFWVNEHYIGEAKTRSLSGIPLEAAKSGIIADGTYFMSTPSPDSLDSRYAMAGNIAQSDIIGKAYEIF